MSPYIEATPGKKWIKGVSPRQPLHRAAGRILRSRLAAVLHWLPLAAEKSDEDVEYVHQLRVSTRRAVEAVRLFSDLIPRAAHRDLRGRLQDLRRVADEARNLDVLCAEFVGSTDASCEDTCTHIADVIRQRRQRAQQPIIALQRELADGGFNDQIAGLLATIETRGKKKSKTTFGQQARRYLKPILREFFKASVQDLSDDENLHQFRICTKKLRYTMEIVEVAFQPCFRRKLYRRISTLQDVMGMVNDHATAKTVFGEWLSQTDDVQQRAFFRGILLAETKAHEDVADRWE
jgi:CHAD domain-containing protein